MQLFPLWETTLLSNKKNQNRYKLPTERFWTKIFLAASHGCSSIPFQVSHCRDTFKRAEWGTTSNCKKSLCLRTVLQLIFHVTYFSQVLANRWEMKPWREKPSGKVNSNLVQNMKVEVTHKRPALILWNLKKRCVPFPTQKHLCLTDLQALLWIWTSHYFSPIFSFSTLSHI